MLHRGPRRLLLVTTGNGEEFRRGWPNAQLRTVSWVPGRVQNTHQDVRFRKAIELRTTLGTVSGYWNPIFDKIRAKPPQRRHVAGAGEDVRLGVDSELVDERARRRPCGGECPEQRPPSEQPAGDAHQDRQARGQDQADDASDRRGTSPSLPTRS